MTTKGKVYLMMSGGVDSSVAAACLKEQGYAVVGVFMKCWSLEQLQNLGVTEDLYGCFWEDDVQDAQLVASKLNIPFEVWDFEETYRQKVVDYMLSEYRIGKTPNPDVMCNSVVKFGVFFEKAMEMGADFVATGHYAKVVKSEILEQNSVIARADDNTKDQSYFLWGIDREKLNKILFPIGEFETKADVRAKAEKLGLITFKKPDSQGLCFIGDTPLRELLLQTIGKKQGKIVDETGRILGSHEGAFLYTVGQREKLGLSGGPWYVSRIEVDANLVVVAHQSELKSLYSSICLVQGLNWQVDIDKFINSKLPLQAQIRYRQKPEVCNLEFDKTGLKVIFDQPVRAIAKGQSIVFYSDNLMLGGGVIC